MLGHLFQIETPYVWVSWGMSFLIEDVQCSMRSVTSQIVIESLVFEKSSVLSVLSSFIINGVTLKFLVQAARKSNN